MYIQYIYDRNILKSSLVYNICEILKSKGFNVIVDNKNNKVIAQDPEEKAKIKNEIVENRSDLYDAFINNKSFNNKFNKTIRQRLEILDIIKPNIKDEEGISEYKRLLLTYKSIILEENNFKTHLSIRALITNDKTTDTIMKDKFKNDLALTAYKGQYNMLRQYKYIMNKYLPEIPIYHFTYKHDDKYLNDSLTLDVEDLRYLKTVIVTTKKNINISTKKDLLKIYMNAFAKMIYGDGIIKVKETRQREGCKVKTYSTRDFNEELFKEHIDLHRINLLRTPEKLLYIDKVIVDKYYSDLMTICPRDSDMVASSREVLQIFRNKCGGF
jgi:hypothetical protein